MNEKTTEEPEQQKMIEMLQALIGPLQRAIKAADESAGHSSPGYESADWHMTAWCHLMGALKYYAIPATQYNDPPNDELGKLIDHSSYSKRTKA